MNNEPVAWMKLDEVLEHFKSVGCGTVYKAGGEGRIPLYTHPAELTDEEIEEIFHHFDRSVWYANVTDFFRKLPSLFTGGKNK